MAFHRLLALGLDPVRLSLHWRDVARSGPQDVDWQLEQAAKAGRSVLLTVGMKAQGWPEFSIPEGLAPDAPPGADVTAGAGGDRLRAATVEFVASMVHRYRDATVVVAWQVENEPLNPSGPRRWWIGPVSVGEEIDAVRRLDAARPICVNAFAHFNPVLDVASSRHGIARLAWRRDRSPEAEALALLAPGDILGLDVYRRIVTSHPLGVRHLSAARSWQGSAARWRDRARAAGRHAWVVEAQAEPWEPGPVAGGQRVSCGPRDVAIITRGLCAAGFDTVLLWGSEHWLAREARGDPAWVTTVRTLVEKAAAGVIATGR